MNAEKFNKLNDALAKKNLHQAYKRAERVGNIAYKRNREVIRTFDVKQDMNAGIKVADKFLDEIDDWIDELKRISDAADDIARHT